MSVALQGVLVTSLGRGESGEVHRHRDDTPREEALRRRCRRPSVLAAARRSGDTDGAPRQHGGVQEGVAANVAVGDLRRGRLQLRACVCPIGVCVHARVGSFSKLD